MAFSVDERFARFGTMRFATDKITSFSVSSKLETVQGENKRFAVMMVAWVGILGGMFMSISNYEASNILGSFSGFVLLAGAVWLLRVGMRLPDDGSRQRKVYKLKIVTNAGEVAAFESASLDEMNQVEAALEQAILDARR